MYLPWHLHCQPRVHSVHMSQHEDPGADAARCRSPRSRERPRGLSSCVHLCERPRLLDNGNPQREYLKQFMMIHFMATVLS